MNSVARGRKDDRVDARRQIFERAAVKQNVSRRVRDIRRRRVVHKMVRRQRRHKRSGRASAD